MTVILVLNDYRNYDYFLFKHNIFNFNKSRDALKGKTSFLFMKMSLNVLGIM